MPTPRVLIVACTQRDKEDLERIFPAEYDVIVWGSPTTGKAYDVIIHGWTAERQKAQYKKKVLMSILPPQGIFIEL